MMALRVLDDSLRDRVVVLTEDGRRLELARSPSVEEMLQGAERVQRTGQAEPASGLAAAPPTLPGPGEPGHGFRAPGSLDAPTAGVAAEDEAFDQLFDHAQQNTGLDSAGLLGGKVESIKGLFRSRIRNQDLVDQGPSRPGGVIVQGDGNGVFTPIRDGVFTGNQDVPSLSLEERIQVADRKDKDDQIAQAIERERQREQEFEEDQQLAAEAVAPDNPELQASLVAPPVARGMSETRVASPVEETVGQQQLSDALGQADQAAQQLAASTPNADALGLGGGNVTTPAVSSVTEQAPPQSVADALIQQADAGAAQLQGGTPVADSLGLGQAGELGSALPVLDPVTLRQPLASAVPQAAPTGVAQSLVQQADVGAQQLREQAQPEQQAGGVLPAGAEDVVPLLVDEPAAGLTPPSPRRRLADALDQAEEAADALRQGTPEADRLGLGELSGRELSRELAQIATDAPRVSQEEIRRGRAAEQLRNAGVPDSPNADPVITALVDEASKPGAFFAQGRSPDRGVAGALDEADAAAGTLSRSTPEADRLGLGGAPLQSTPTAEIAPEVPRRRSVADSLLDEADRAAETFRSRPSVLGASLAPRRR